MNSFLKYFAWVKNNKRLKAPRAQSIENRAKMLKADCEMRNAEFYKTFWLDIREPLINALNYSYNLGYLSVTQKRGIIKLIPQKDTELYYIQNWRPLSLLNTDYKIAAKSIANRIKRVLPTLIDADQTGFMKGRFIGESIRLIDSLITYTAYSRITAFRRF